MKHNFYFLVLLALAFFIGFFAAVWKRDGSLCFAVLQRMPEAAPLRFLPTPYPEACRPFSVIVIGRNNGAYLEKTLQSVLEQKYQPFRMIYVDDASDDGSFDLAKEKVQVSLNEKRVQWVHHAEPQGIYFSLLDAVACCMDQEIIVVLRGEDWLAHPWVLQRLNQYYANRDLWMTCGRSCIYPSFAQNSFSAHQETADGDVPYTFRADFFKKSVEKLSDGSVGMTDSLCMQRLWADATQHAQRLPDVLYMVNQTAASLHEAGK